MRGKIKVIILLTIFLSALFLGLRAESYPGINDKVKIEDIAKRVYPSVVKVEVKNLVRKVATGVVIDKEGFIVTTALMFPREEKISVITSEGQRIDAKFLGMDPETNLALIQAKDSRLTPITIGQTKDISPGSWIGVISFSPENTSAVTQGIVSSISPERIRLNVWVVRGASGSPVVDRNGRMVGLLRGVYFEEHPVAFEFQEKEVVGRGLVLSRAEAPASGMAQAIPVEVVSKVISEIKEKGKVSRGWLGVRIAENEAGKVEIVEIDRESPAEMAKLRERDIILEVDGKAVTGDKMLGDEIRKRKPGETVTLKLERDGKATEIKVKLGEYPEEEFRRALELKFPRLFPLKPATPVEPFLRAEPKTYAWSLFKRKYIGVSLQETTRELAEYFGVKEGTGLLVAKVKEGSPAEKAGLKAGDVIVQADGERVEKIQALNDLIKDKPKGSKIKVEFLRDRKKMTAEVEVEEEERGRLPEEFGLTLRNWDDYVDYWDVYSRNFWNQYKGWQDDFVEVSKKQMNKLKEEMEEKGKEGKEASKNLSLYFKKLKGIKI